MSEAGKPPPSAPTPLPASASAPQAPTQLSIEEFQKVSLRVGVIISAEDHPNADRLLVLKVDLGTETRQLVAGIRGAYQASDLIGKRVVVVANLKPATLRGIESQGMVLAAQDGTVLALVTPERPVQAGGIVK